jgi:hypothetical protein
MSDESRHATVIADDGGKIQARTSHKRVYARL